MLNKTDVRQSPSVCPLDCPDTCSLVVDVAGDSIVRVRGSTSNPLTEGVICEKVAKYYPDFVHGKRRLKQPLKRTGERGGNDFKAISWPEALDLTFEGINSSIERFGPESVLPLNYAGPHGQLSGGSMDLRFFHRMGATLLNRSPLCGGVRSTAYGSLFGQAPGISPEQALHSDLIIVWGTNITVSNLHFMRIIKTAKKRGAKLVVIDPKRIKASRQADLYLQVHPGSDVVLGMAMAAEFERRGMIDQSFVTRNVHGYDAYMEAARRYTLDDARNQCRIGDNSVETFIQLYTECKNVSMICGVGLERSRNGGSSIRSAMALQALTGNFGAPGKGIIGSHGAAYPKTPDRLQGRDMIVPGTREFNIVDAAEKLLQKDLAPPVQAVFIYNHNPVCTHPEQNRMRQALSRPELFIAGADVTFTDSMRYADVVFPCASHFEHDDLYAAYGHKYLQRAEAVIPAVGEAVPNTELFRRLARRFGYNEPCFQDSDRDLIDTAIDAADGRLQGHRPSNLPVQQAFTMDRNEEDWLLTHNIEPQTPSGRIELYSESMQTLYQSGVPAYRKVKTDFPFVLVSPSSNKRTNATFGGHPASGGLEILQINPDDAEAFGIVNGSTVKVSNDSGNVVLKADLTDTVAPGVLYSAKGTWLETSPSGQTVNALISASTRTDIADGACYNDTFVTIEGI